MEEKERIEKKQNREVSYQGTRKIENKKEEEGDKR